MKIDPIIAVADVEKSSQWYQAVFGCKSIHGGKEFDVLVSSKDEIFLCLHKWGAHEHPSMKNSNGLVSNGLILYFRVENMEEIHQKLKELSHPLTKEIALNPNSNKKEFSLIDPDGYHLTVTEFHTFAS